MTDRPNVKWTGRTEYAEVAEAIGITTEHVIGTMERDDGRLVMWSEAWEYESPIVGTLLRRDGAGIYRVIHTGLTGQTLGDMTEYVRRGMEGRGR